MIKFFSKKSEEVTETKVKTTDARFEIECDDYYVQKMFQFLKNGETFDIIFKGNAGESFKVTAKSSIW